MDFGMAHDKPNDGDCNSEPIPPSTDELVTDLRHIEQGLIGFRRGYFGDRLVTARGRFYWERVGLLMRSFRIL